jgi:IS30 family transposase
MRLDPPSGRNMRPCCHIMAELFRQSVGVRCSHSHGLSGRTSLETIYRSLFIQARELMQHLRSKRWIRRSRHSGIRGQSRGQIVDALSIRERSAEIEDQPFPVIGRAICLAPGTVTS